MFEYLSQHAIAIALVLAVVALGFKLFSERRRKEREIKDGIENGLAEADRKGYGRGFQQAETEWEHKLSRPLSPNKLRKGKYKVEYILLNWGIPIAAVVVQDVVVEGKEKGRTREAWLISLPYNRRLTQPAPFTLVVDEAGIGYEPWQEPIAPPTEPPKADEAAA